MTAQEVSLGGEAREGGMKCVMDMIDDDASGRMRALSASIFFFSSCCLLVCR